MSTAIKSFFKQQTFFRIIYREIYHLWRELSVLLFSSWLKKSKLPVITRERTLKDQEKYKLQSFGSVENIVLGEFVMTQEVPKRVSKKIEQKEVKATQPFVAEFNQVEIIGNKPVAFDSQTNLILESTLPIFNPIPIHIAKNISIKTILKAKTKPQANEEKPLDIACLLVNPWSNNFWHWTVDTLTQLEGIEYYYQQTGIKPKLIVEPNLRGWQRESLRLLGYEEPDFIYWQDYRRQVNKLIVSSFRRSYDGQHGEISVNACHWLRKTMLDNLANSEDKQYGEKAYISRCRALGRRVHNEAEVMAVLEPLGFRLHILEEMSYPEQVRLFAQAKTIIAPHGAGLTNLLFAENPIILELFGAYVGNEFANLSRSLGFKYGCLACGSPQGEMRVKDGDMVVDTSELLKLLEVMES